MGRADQGQWGLDGLSDRYLRSQQPQVTQAPIDPSMPIRLAENFRAVFYAPFYAAQSLRFYAKEGVEIEFVSSSVPGDGASALLDDTVDLTWGGPMRVMKAHDQQPSSPLVCFCEVVARDPFYLVGRHHRPDFQLRDLASLTFAAVSEVPTPWMCLQNDLRKHGIDPSRLARAPDQSMAANFDGLCKGQLDVVQLFEPYPSMALQLGAGHVLYAASARGPTVYTTFIATRGGIDRHRYAFAGMTRAMARMQDWLTQHSAEELADITAPFYPDIARSILVSSLRRYGQAGIWARAPDVSREGFTRLGECLVSGGFISRMPIYEDCVDQSLDAAVARRV
jgi:NitT/TauT family transport system substrate-binding protein